ncbi:UbiH/UbiF/VisC/COQ6 family ubiquinone biosynthesis hydroxylase [Alkalilimnicola sp. S0819]|uniref:UbiH/UbiF/VisC/COQ6 family ubiquinone biosynthesis hydroxylase n=1 Tax=Alkalilimnicola sp. S0819 TaxID=2613922 RepID=UPI00126198DA|nr:UbiH/UbiF/VisC/COQ6 family ubiquinone biosynthesis hydroxylase [Alkalilimnicola sp. S0819]KAB7628211.1 UbiH/UbiF/VisC/COQ6 family ubiquinone biosynthesis hydroxylase [Alkalilimnicola sp. S0819]MPQ15102.1 hypothetical protein [Alkalilimnicola sp. S0819]
MERYDCIIHGAGMVGLSLACALAEGGLSVAVLEAAPLRRWSPEETPLRVAAVNRASERMLRRLGVWEGLEAARVSPFQGISAWDGEGGGAVHFDALSLGEPHMGHIIENRLTQTVLHDRFLSLPGARLLAPASLAGFHREGDEMRLRLEDGRRLCTSLLVGADGAGSAVRKIAGMPLEQREYGQRGLVCAISTEQPHGAVARQRFLSGGPLALLPLADGRCSIVWSLPEARAKALLAADKSDFLTELNRAAQGLLGQVLDCGERAAFPLRRQHARQYVQPGLALVGDAAHVIHPLAGQGANLGWLDAAALAQLVLAAAAAGKPLGGHRLLRRYERWRKGDNLMMQSAMDGFHWLFTQSPGWLAGLRSLGMDLTDRLPPAKRLIMSRAMGEGGELPRLCQSHPIAR